MRVLLVNSHGADPSYGGAERYVRDLAHGLEAGPHDVTVLSAYPPRGDAGLETVVLHGDDPRDNQLRRLRTHAGDVISMPWPSLGRVLDGVVPDLVHTSNLPGIGTGIWEAADSRGIPVVHTLHDYHLLCPRATLTRRDGSPCEPSPLLCGQRSQRLARWAGRVREVIAGSEHLLGVHDGFFPAARRSVLRLPLAPIGDSPPPPPPEPPLSTIGYLGALTETKGIRLLLAAVPTLAEQRIEIRIAGDGPLREQVEASGARYCGRVEGESKLEFLRSCDAGVVPSVWDEPSGPPYVISEWRAARRPVLSTSRGGLAEATRLGGVVAFEESPDGLVEAALRLREPREWMVVSKACPVVSDRTDVNRWLGEHLTVYERARSSGSAAVDGPTESM